MADASTKAPEPGRLRELYATGTIADGGPYLAGGRCESCGKACFPKRMVCPHCGSDQIADAMLGRRGRVKTAAVVYSAPPGFVAPYVLALVEFEEGLVVMAPLVGWSADEAPEAGTDLELLVAPAKAGGRAVAQYRIVDGREELVAQMARTLVAKPGLDGHDRDGRSPTPVRPENVRRPAALLMNDRTSFSPPRPPEPAAHRAHSSTRKRRTVTRRPR